MGRDARLNQAAATALGLPIVGKPFEFIKWFPTVVIKCQCEQGDVLLLAGAHGSATCRACRKMFAVAEAGPVTVGVVQPPAASDAPSEGTQP